MATVRPPRAGVYSLRAATSAPPSAGLQVALGDSIAGRIVRTILGAFAIGGLGLMAGIGLIVTTAVRRRRRVVVGRRRRRLRRSMRGWRGCRVERVRFRVAAWWRRCGIGARAVRYPDPARPDRADGRADRWMWRPTRPAMSSGAGVDRVAPARQAARQCEAPARGALRAQKARRDAAPVARLGGGQPAARARVPAAARLGRPRRGAGPHGARPQPVGELDDRDLDALRRDDARREAALDDAQAGARRRALDGRLWSFQVMPCRCSPRTGEAAARVAQHWTGATAGPGRGSSRPRWRGRACARRRRR